MLEGWKEQKQEMCFSFRQSCVSNVTHSLVGSTTVPGLKSVQVGAAVATLRASGPRSAWSMERGGGGRNPISGIRCRVSRLSG
eukprot:5384760-Prymnesium_polylepis.1